MNDLTVNLRQEQEATLARPRLAYGLLTRTLFIGMDLLYGRETTLPKMRLLEILARIPYQSWEVRQYIRLHSEYGQASAVAEARKVMLWGRAAQDNEFWHLRVIDERMKQLGIGEGFFRSAVIRWVAVFKYTIFSRLLARFNIRQAFRINAEFEDHAEHVYMLFVKEHPELETQKVEGTAVAEVGEFSCWADVFRRIGLDERDHRNESLIHCGCASDKVPYLG